MIRSISGLIHLFLISISLSSSAWAGPLNLRYPAPSPDGSKICFSYLGDLWTLSSQGGKAERLTVHVGYDAYPKWSPDGNFIAFSSQRHGNFDVYVIPATGGAETRITYHSAEDIVSGWTSDSKRVLFTSRREQSFETVWEVNAGGGRARPLVMIQAADGRKSQDGSKLLFTHGAVPWWRKGYHGSAACDLFAKDANSGSIERITTYSGNDFDGFWLPDVNGIVYLSDSTGTYNLATRNLVSGVVTQLTNHRLNAAHLSLSQDGSLAAYELGGDVFLYDLKANRGRKLEVEISSGAKTNFVERVVYDSGATEMAISPDGKMIAYVVHGNIFCRDVDGYYQKQLTDSPANDYDLSWSIDSRKLAFVSNRKGSNDIYLLLSSDPSQPSLALANERETVALITSDAPKHSPQIAPDQTKIAFVRSETQLVAADMKRFTERTFDEGNPVGTYSWSPDGRYLVYTRFDPGWHNRLFIGDSESGETYQISDSPGSYQKPRFSADGKIIYFINNNDLYYLFLEQRVAETAFSKHHLVPEQEVRKNALGLPMVTIDFDHITERQTRLTHVGNVIDVAMSPNSSTFICATADNRLERINLDAGEQKQLSSLNSEPSQLQIVGGAEVAFFRDGLGRLNAIDLANGVAATLRYKAEMIVDLRQEYLQVFNETWRTVKDRFYDESLHGVDWNKMRELYLPRAEAATEINDLHDIIREMVGELNASHLNIWPGQVDGDETGYVGVIPDYEDNSAGLKIKAIIPQSPATKIAAQLKVDEKIMSVNGRRIIANQDYYLPFEGTVGNEVALELINRDGIARTVDVTPVSAEEYLELEYRSRVEKACEQVGRLTRNRVAYLRLPQIDREGIEVFEKELSNSGDGKQGLILDIRDNIGGSEHDKLLELLSRRSYIVHKSRYGSSGTDPSDAFVGTIILLINERTSSDAEIFAQGFRELGLGTILGVNTYGAVIGTEHRSLLDGSTFSVPSVGWFTLKDDKLENRGVAPDVEILADLTRLEKGEDNQLEEAVKLLLPKLK